MTEAFTTYLTNCQITRLVVFSVGFMGCLIIAYHELKHYRMLKREQKLKQKWLSIWYWLSLFSATIAQILILSEAIPNTHIIHICTYTTHLAIFAWFCKLIFLGLYQIRRLQMIFVNETCVESSCKISLSATYKLLYVGSVIILFLAISFVCAVTVTNYHEYGCIWTYNQLGSIINWIWMFIYLCWDGGTLFVYIWKLSEYRRAIKPTYFNAENNASTLRLYQNIKSALSKIILLTLVYEVTSTIVAILCLIDNNIIPQNKYVAILWWTMISVDTFITAFVVYLMQMHNQQHYYSFLWVLKKLHLTICCKTLAHDANMHMRSTSVKNEQCQKQMEKNEQDLQDEIDNLDI